MAKVTLVVDGVEYRVEKGSNLLHACLSLGLDLPYFCWHPALGSVGACRQCAVKKLGDDRSGDQIVMACMTPVEDGTRISITDEDATSFRDRIIEWLMINHPHDCPVCDEGGECHLQDMTAMSHHVYRRHRFAKRTHRNQYLGPFIHHEMNRCIQCYRCVRFYRDHAGGDDLDVFGAHDHVYFGRHRDGVLESPFAGNLVEVCPTGVFTDKTLRRHYTRKWDLQAAPSICVHCGLGCNTTAGERSGVLRRILNRYHADINGYFLCDRGRFGYEFVNGPTRLRRPLVRRDGVLEEADGEQALDAASEVLARCDTVLGIGSPRASLETNFALREMVGPDRFSIGMTARQADLVRLAAELLRCGPYRAATLADAERADAVLVLGEDVGATAPRAELALRQAARTAPLEEVGALGIHRWHDAAVRDALQGRTGPFYVATPTDTTLDGVATSCRRAAPADVARLGFAIAHRIDDGRPQVRDLDGSDAQLADSIASALEGAERPLVVAGTSVGVPEVLHAAAAVGSALGERARLLLVVPECNSLGVTMMGGGSLEEVLETLEDGGRTGVIVAENDLLVRDTAAARKILDAAEAVVVLDHTRTGTVEASTVALPTATFAEGAGTLVSAEGRAQRFFAAMPPSGEVRDGWRRVRDLRGDTGSTKAPTWHDLDDVLEALAGEMPELGGAVDAAPQAAYRLDGQRVPRQPPRFSGRTALTAHLDVREVERDHDPDSPLSYSMEGSRRQPPGSLTPFFWAPGWNSIQSVNTSQREVGGPLEDGGAGVRLLEPDADASAPGSKIPQRFSPTEGRWLVLPLHRVFGSEELSRLAPGVAELAPEPSLAMAPADAERLGIRENDAVTIEISDTSFELPAELRAELVEGTVLLPVGADGVPAFDLPTMARLHRGGAG